MGELFELFLREHVRNALASGALREGGDVRKLVAAARWQADVATDECERQAKSVKADGKNKK